MKCQIYLSISEAPPNFCVRAANTKISAKFRLSEDNARFSDKPSAKAVLVLLSVRKSEFSEQNVSLLTIYQRTARTSSSDKFSFSRMKCQISTSENIENA